MIVTPHAVEWTFFSCLPLTILIPSATPFILCNRPYPSAGKLSWKEIPESVISVWSFAANQQTCTSGEWTWRLHSVLYDSDESKPRHLNFRCLDSEDLKGVMSGSSKRGKKNEQLHF